VTVQMRHSVRIRTRHDASASPRISVVIPLYNGAAYIAEALHSVLDQTLPPAEIIVVDDGSTDEGPSIVSSLAAAGPIVLLHKPNGGQSSARNFGVAHSNGELIAFLDQDDIWYQNHLEELSKPFRRKSHPEIGWVYSNLDRISADGRMVTRSFLSYLGAQHPKRELTRCLGEDMFILPSASLVSRKAFLSVGGFDERLCGYEDDDLFLRMFLRGYDNVFIDKPLSKWRIYATSTSYSPRMARSRMIYARKLFEEFTDRPEMGEYFARDCTAPRFYRQIINQYLQAVRIGQPCPSPEVIADLRYVSRFLSRRMRLVVSVASPFLRSRWTTRAMLASGPIWSWLGRRLLA
jgi:glycosyltransferase involved in cell wall biosynthesis